MSQIAVNQIDGVNETQQSRNTDVKIKGNKKVDSSSKVFN